MLSQTRDAAVSSQGRPEGTVRRVRVPGTPGHPVPPGWALLAQLPGGHSENNCSPRAPVLRQRALDCVPSNSILFPAPVPGEWLAPQAQPLQQLP